MVVLPQWARKPEYKKEVIATNKGWVVKETGEVLKLVRDLDERLKRLEKDAVGISASIGEVEKQEEVKDVEKPVEDEVTEAVVTNIELTEEVSSESTEDEKEVSTEAEEQSKKKPGRKPKSQRTAK